MARVVHASSSTSARSLRPSADASKRSGAALPSGSWLPSPRRILASLCPFSPLELLETAVLWPLELYESIIILPVGFVRRQLPTLGGALVLLMTLHGLLLRLALDVVRSLLARATYSRDVALNYRAFWQAMRDRYAFFALCETDWHAVHKVFGEPLATTTSDDDLWLALQESVALCDDPALRVTRPAVQGPFIMSAFGRAPLAAQRFKYESAAMDVMQRRHLTDGGRQIANHFVYGILNAETSPGWRIGYLSLNAMDGFVDFPVPGPLWGSASNGNASTAGKSVAVPETYDLESMRWALEAVLKSLGDVDALILDVRFNRGGGSVASALAVASFFTGPRKAVAFLTDEKVSGPNAHRFSKKRRHYVPQSPRPMRYSGPLVVLQSQYTKGTAEMLTLALMDRPATCRIGARSSGSLTQTRKLRLPNYWTAEIPYLRCFSAQGELFEGVGVPVDKRVERMEEAVMQRPRGSDFDPCIKTAIDHIMHM